MNYFTGNGGSRKSSLYLKAQEIRNISRRISDYLIPDLSGLNEKGLEDKNVYFTGDIIRHSNSLIFNISKAESEYFQDNRKKYISSVNRLTDMLYKACEKLEKSNSNGREFLKILRRELIKFRKLQAYWKLGL